MHSFSGRCLATKKIINWCRELQGTAPNSYTLGNKLICFVQEEPGTSHMQGPLMYVWLLRAPIMFLHLII